MKDLEYTVLPSRKERHPKPKTIFEKPIFPLILFVLFLLILSSIFILYTYTQRSEQGTSSNVGTHARDPGEVETDQKEVETTEHSFDEKELDELDTTTNESGVLNPNSGEVPNTVDKTSDNKDVNEQNPVSTNEQADPTSDDSATDPKKITEEEVTIYIVKPGDTLFSIAKKFYNSKAGIETIKTANGMKDNNIKIGMKLKIPTTNPNP